MWRQFVNNTTLHGIRHVFTKRRVFIRVIWFLLILASGGYYISSVYRAVEKYRSRPIKTVLSTKHPEEIFFPAVTICPLNLYAKSKINMKDTNPLFALSGLNITSCAVTSQVRGNRACGSSLLCLQTKNDSMTLLPNCTSRYKHDLSNAMRKSNHRLDIESFYQYYSQNISTLIGPLCRFGWQEAECSAKDFFPKVSTWGMCYTFNSGAYGRVKKVDVSGVASGLSIILDTQTHEYTYGKNSEGFKVLVHGQGEYFDEFEGVNVGPGQHVLIGLTQKRFKNLESPYATRCTRKTLRTYSIYSTAGCIEECEDQQVAKVCGCRLPGHKGVPLAPLCTSPKERLCVNNEINTLKWETCDCEVPCEQTKYITEVSHSRFPDVGTAKKFVMNGYYDDIQYQRDNLLYLQVGFKSLSYDMQEQQSAYDRNSLFGEIGGNMGLFLGCSLLTLIEFFDFLLTFLTRRRRKSRETHPA